MKKSNMLIMALGLSVSTALAQGQPGRPGGSPRGGRPPMPPIMAALDTNRDSVIDSNEIANAAAALKTLDKNGDGKLSSDELMPKPPGGTNEFRFNPPPGGKPPVPPIMAALDTNGDGELDATEIENASTALLKLDANGDGKLTREETAPKHPYGGPGGPDAADGPPGGPEGSDGPPPEMPPDNGAGE
jgi:uncharacterized protein (DUF2141 family)